MDLILIISYFLCLVSLSSAFRTFDVNGVETILALENEDIKINCKTDSPMAYCGFIHPSGKRLSFSGSSLEAGQCAVKINASKSDSGEWRCHIGRKGIIGLEDMQIINLRVVGDLAAVQSNITTLHGKTVTISCATTKGMLPLRYCRFEPPNGKPFSISSDVVPEFPILNRYYFPGNKSLDRGDCAVTIRKVKYEDAGAWTCGAGLDDGREHTDNIYIDVEGLYAMSKASATGITFGAFGIITVLSILAFLVWKKKRLLGTSEPQDLEDQEMRSIQCSRQGSLQGSRQGSRPGSRQGSRQASPEASPLIRRIPLVLVESPSEQNSPL